MATDPIEPDEILPPESESSRSESSRRNPWEQWKASFGPVLLGVAIDALDFLTFGAQGLRIGFLFGSLAAYFLCSLHRIPFRYKVPLALAAGIYCMLPATERFPLATLIGIITRSRRR